MQTQHVQIGGRLDSAREERMKTCWFILVMKSLDSDWLLTHHHQLSLRRAVPGSEHHPPGGGSQAVALRLGLADGHAAHLSVTLQEHQLPGGARRPLSLNTNQHSGTF